MSTTAPKQLEPISELARKMIDLDEPLHEGAEINDPLALAWALKEQCYAAWNTEPQRAAKAASALRALHLRLSASDMSAAIICEIDALAHWIEGIACVTCGEMSEAVKCFDSSAQLFRDLGQGNHAAQTQVPKIMALSIVGQLDEAGHCAEHTQRELLKNGETLAASKVSLNLGNLHVRRGAYLIALGHYRAAAVLFARLRDHEYSVSADIGVADAHTYLGDFDEALRIFSRARMRAVTHGFPVLEALIELNVARLELVRGRYREALSGFEMSRRHFEQIGHLQNVATAEMQLAEAYLELNLLPEALALFDQALLKFHDLEMPDDQALALSQRGRVLARQNRASEAIESFNQAATLFEAQGSGVGKAGVTLASAELSLVRGDNQSALDLATQAAQGFDSANQVDGCVRADILRAEAMQRSGQIEEARALLDATLTRSRKLQLLAVEVRCLTGLGMAAQSIGDRATAKAAFSSAIELFEAQRSALPGDEIRSAFLTDHLRPYQEQLRMALAEYAEAGSATPAIEVLRRLEHFRARVLGERLEAGNTIDADNSTQSMRTRLNWLYRQVQRQITEGESSAALVDELRDTERELLERARRHRLTAQRAPDAISNDDFDVKALQGLLRESDALIEYGVLDDELFACVVTREQVALHRHIANWPQVLEAIRAARFQIETLRHGAAPVAQHLPMLTKRAESHMARLHALVWAPLAQAIAGCKRILVVPHAQLGLLPFAALHDGKSCLIQHHEIAVVASARIAIRGLRRLPCIAERALVLGESSRLPHAAEEANMVANLFAQAKSFVAERATLDALHANASEADVIHLACHAQFRADNPMFSALHLHDGALTVEATESMKLKPGVVVLSACETGVAEHSTGDEMVGLVRAFLVAGAARVLGSLWPVDDGVTEKFMTLFYGALFQGKAPASALRFAQTEVMQQHPHPFYWAAFTLHGGW